MFWGMGVRAPAGERRVATERAVRVLYVRTEGRAAISRAARREQEVAGLAPRRVLVEEAFGFDLLGESDLTEIPGLRGRVLRSLPTFLALGLEAARRGRDYDVIVTWAEKYTVGVATALRLFRRRPRHVAILDWVSKPVVRVPLRMVRRGVDDVLTWSSVQAAAAERLIGFPPERIHRIEHPVDERFFAPVEHRRTSVVAAGETQRDYPTLVAAVAGIGLPTIIAADLVGSFQGVRTRLTDARTALGEVEGVQVGPMAPADLREAYASAVAVVVPLVPADNNAGISVVLEAMAMGRPVIVSRTVGQVDVVEDGVNGLYVRPGDADDLREKILRLAGDPLFAEELGRRGRETVTRLHRTADFVAAVRSHVLTAVTVPR